MQDSFPKKRGLYFLNIKKQEERSYVIPRTKKDKFYSEDIYYLNKISEYEHVFEEIEGKQIYHHTTFKDFVLFGSLTESLVLTDFLSFFLKNKERELPFWKNKTVQELEELAKKEQRCEKQILYARPCFQVLQLRRLEEKVFIEGDFLTGWALEALVDSFEEF